MTWTPARTEAGVRVIKHAQAAAGVPKTELARQYGIHRDTVYRYLAADGT